jgi:metallo-beta-lactamase family protein
MIILTGYQAPGTRGASIAGGAKSVRIHGHDVELQAEVVQLQSASAHADASQLLAWLRTMPKAPDQVYVTHGEWGASDEFRKRIKHELGWRAIMPEHGSTWPT